MRFLTNLKKTKGGRRRGEGVSAARTRSDLRVRGFRGGLVFKAHILLHYSTLGSRGIEKKKEGVRGGEREEEGWASRAVRPIITKRGGRCLYVS